MKIKTKDDRRVRIQLRQRKRISGTKERPRLSVFRSVTHIYAQVIDDMSGADAGVGVDRRAVAQGRVRQGRRAAATSRAPRRSARSIAERSIEKGIKRVVFDRSGFLYHGRIRAVADAARKAGLEF